MVSPAQQNPLTPYSIVSHNTLLKVATGPLAGIAVAGYIASRTNPTTTLGSLKDPLLYAAVAMPLIMYSPEIYNTGKDIVVSSVKGAGNIAVKAVSDVVEGIQEFIKKNPIKTVVAGSVIGLGLGYMYGPTLVESGKGLFVKYAPKNISNLFAPKAMPSAIAPAALPAPQALPLAPQALPPAPQVLPPAPQVLPSAPQELPLAPQALPSAPQELPLAPQALPSAPQELPPAPQALPPAPQALPSAPQELPPAPQAQEAVSVEATKILDTLLPESNGNK